MLREPSRCQQKLRAAGVDADVIAANCLPGSKSLGRLARPTGYAGNRDFGPPLNRHE